MIEEAELRSKNAIDDMEDRVRALAQVHRNLENLRADLLSDIKSFASDAVEKVGRVKAQIKSVDIEDELLKIKRDNLDRSSPKVLNTELEESTPVEEVASIDEATNDMNGKHTDEELSTEPTVKSTSFIDEIQ